MKSKKNLIYSHYHYKFFDKIIFKKRLEIVKIIQTQIDDFKIKDVLDIGTTNDDKNNSSNIIVKNLKRLKNFKSISNQKIKSSFFKKKLNKSITGNFSKKEFNELRSDLVISNATIEHVGSLRNQKKMISNMIKFSKKIFIIITPNRYYPIDFHTKLPFFHWLPKPLHRLILNFIGLKFYANEKNLNLLSKNDFKNIIDQKEVSFRITSINLLKLPSNLILIGKKSKF
mgnify:CR=1 FL=1